MTSTSIVECDEYIEMIAVKIRSDKNQAIFTTLKIFFKIYNQLSLLAFSIRLWERLFLKGMVMGDTLPNTLVITFTGI